MSPHCPAAALASLLGALALAALPALAHGEKRGSLGLGLGALRRQDQASTSASPRWSSALEVAASYEVDASLRWAWQVELGAGHAFGGDAPWLLDAEAGASYRLDILAWVPYLRGAVGVRSLAASDEVHVAPTATAALGIMRLRDRDTSWRGELRYRIALDVTQGAPQAHQVGIWLARTWHWDYF